jgi:hypothetical protein
MASPSVGQNGWSPWSGRIEYLVLVEEEDPRELSTGLFLRALRARTSGTRPD